MCSKKTPESGEKIFGANSLSGQYTLQVEGGTTVGEHSYVVISDDTESAERAIEDSVERAQIVQSQRRQL